MWPRAFGDLGNPQFEVRIDASIVSGTSILPHLSFLVFKLAGILERKITVYAQTTNKIHPTSQTPQTGEGAHKGRTHRHTHQLRALERGKDERRATHQNKTSAKVAQKRTNTTAQGEDSISEYGQALGYIPTSTQINRRDFAVRITVHGALQTGQYGTAKFSEQQAERGVLLTILYNAEKG